MTTLCTDSVLTGQEGTITFTPPGTSVCVRDFTPFEVADSRILLECGADFRVNDKVVFTEEDGGNLDSSFTPITVEYYVVAVGTDSDGTPYIQVSTTANGTPIAPAGDGGVTTAGVLTTGGMGAITAGSGGTDGTYENVKLTTSGSGIGAEATIVVASNVVDSVTITKGGSGYADTDTISAASADIGNVTGFSQAITSVSATNGDSPLPAHINIELADYLSVCGVREFSIDITRDELDVTTLPCADDDGTTDDCAKLAEFRRTQAGYASATGTMSVYFTCDQENIANRLLGASLLKSQAGAKVRLYVCTKYDGGEIDNNSSLYIDASISVTGMSFSVNPDDATTAELTFSVRKMNSVFGLS